MEFCTEDENGSCIFPRNHFGFARTSKFGKIDERDRDVRSFKQKNSEEIINFIVLSIVTFVYLLR